MSFEKLIRPAEELLELLRAKSMMLAVAESCTGGLVCAALTEVAGSSDVVERGFITYSNNAKISLLGVAPELIEVHGAVSKQVALAMAEGALKASEAQVSVSITGIAGPTGGSADKPVGLVHFALCVEGRDPVCLHREFGELGRHEIRVRAVLEVFSLIRKAVS